MASIWSFFGWSAVCFQIGYSFVGIFFIELINYTEHYGLLRSKDKRGIYEPVNHMHSWNAASSPLLFRIQRHSDHHVHSSKPYQTLRKLDGAPHLPFDYVNSFFMALCPPLWFKVMDPRLPSNTKKVKLDEEGQMSTETKVYFIAVNLAMTLAMLNNF
jgi:alkane 1-monooxygenase